MRAKLTGVFSAAALCLAAALAQGVEFHVSPGGDNGNAGTSEAPFARLARARDAVRAVIAKGLTEDVTVLVHGGTYRVTEPVAFGPEDGGTDEFGVTYAAAEGESPVLSGGRPITGWHEADDGTWTVELPDVKAGRWDFRTLWVGGRRAVRARHPNDGYLHVEEAGADRKTNFRYAPGDLNAYPDLEDVELVFLHDWSITRVPVKSVDEATRTLTVEHRIGGSLGWGLIDHFEKHPRYFLENLAKFLDAPGEWFLDRKTGVLRYRPQPGEKIGSVEIVAPAARQLLVVRGDVEGGRPVRRLHFEGISCEHTAWFPPERVYWGRQACTYWTPTTFREGRDHEEADPAAVHFEGAEACGFLFGRIAHVGSSGLWLGRGCRKCEAAGCVVSDCGGNGIMIGEGKARTVDGQAWWEAVPEQAAVGNAVMNCLVEHCGRELYGAVGIWVGLAGKTLVMHNEVRQVPYTGVSAGWMWWRPTDRPEPRPTPCRETDIAFNHIHHVMQMLSDGGGIYTLGRQPGGLLRDNLIHDVPANAGRAESNGMFLDQGTGGLVIEGNVIYNVARSPLRFHKGWKNVVRKNFLETRPGVPTVRYNDTVRERIVLEENTIVPKVPADVIEDAASLAGPMPEARKALKALEAGLH